MSTFKYTVKEINLEGLDTSKQFKDSDKKLIESFDLTTAFDTSKHSLNLFVYSVDNVLLQNVLDYPNYSALINAAGAGKDGILNITLDPARDAKELGYENGDIRLLYKFTDDLFSEDKRTKQFFIESISPDRTEIRALSNQLTDEEISEYTAALSNRLNDGSFFSEFNLNFEKLVSSIGVNVTTENTDQGLALVIKLYQPLDSSVAIKDLFNVVELVSDSKFFEITSEFLEDKINLGYLKGPNFNVEVVEDSFNPTEYFSYNELLSFPVTSSYYELRSLFNEKSAQIAINHEDYNDFIHFSSAEERLRNFKYKLDLINSYQSSLYSVKTTGYTKTGVTGSISYYENLIEGIVNNFDHYDRYLYYESGSSAWPKTNSTRPYINQASTTSESITYFTNQLVSASNYDNTNVDILTNTIPTFIREDSQNAPYTLFVHMIAQHFDNLWIYFKAVSDKYDADNRLNFGVSKDIVKSAVESLGVKLYSSNQSLDNLFSLLTGESYASGSETINEIVTAVSGSGSDHLQPMPKDNYLKEIYKRIYHNLPLILKSKGTERGIRAIINSFGIPNSILPVKIYGGKNKNDIKFTNQNFVTSSLAKVRLDNTGSLVSGSTLSRYASTTSRKIKYSDDLHTVEVGFSLSKLLDNYIESRLSGSFNIDDFIGDPRDATNDSYHELNKLRNYILGLDDDLGSNIWNVIQSNWEDYDAFWDRDDIFRTPSAFIRLVKFFDNSVFRVIKDLIPARSTINTGVVVKPDILTRNKAKQVSLTLENKIYTGSINVSTITGSHGESFGSKDRYNTNYSASILTSVGYAPKNESFQTPKFTGEFSGSLVMVSDGELNTANTFKKAAQPIIDFNLTVFNLSLPIPPSCDLFLRATYVGDLINFYGETGRGTVRAIYPETVAATSGSINLIVDYTLYEYAAAVAEGAAYGGGGYTGVFDGWYTQAQGSGSLITTGSTITVTNELQLASGSEYYANFLDE